MSDFTIKQACAQALRKVAAARRQLESIPVLFGDLDGVLQNQAHELVALTDKQFTRFERDVTDVRNGEA